MAICVFEGDIFFFFHMLNLWNKLYDCYISVRVDEYN